MVRRRHHPKHPEGCQCAICAQHRPGCPCPACRTQFPGARRQFRVRLKDSTLAFIERQGGREWVNAMLLAMLERLEAEEVAR